MLLTLYAHKDRFMKKFLFAWVMALAVCVQSGCRTTQVYKAPPGQVKKATGSPSAKPYAPGQVKKATGAKSAKSYAPGQVNKKQKKGKH